MNIKINLYVVWAVLACLELLNVINLGWKVIFMILAVMLIIETIIIIVAMTLLVLFTNK